MFSSITPLHWVALGLLLLIAEMFGASGFLLGAAVAAFAMGVIVWLMPDLGLAAQMTMYAVGASVLTVVYFQLFRDAQKKPSRPLLNDRAKRMIGHQFTLEKSINATGSKVQIGDTLWAVEVHEALEQGTLVEVTDANEMTLRLAVKENA